MLSVSLHVIEACALPSGARRKGTPVVYPGVGFLLGTRRVYRILLYLRPLVKCTCSSLIVAFSFASRPSSRRRALILSTCHALSGVHFLFTTYHLQFSTCRVSSNGQVDITIPSWVWLHINVMCVSILGSVAFSLVCSIEVSTAPTT